MTQFADMLQQGGGTSLLFVPTAVVLGALHGLEPGHSKTMMAAFIVAVRGTVAQAVLLGLAATLSHTLVVWAVAIGGMYFLSGLDAETTEPYFQVASAAIIIVIAVSMLRRTWNEQREVAEAKAAIRAAAATRPAMRQVDTGHGHVGLELKRDDGVGAARWHLSTISGHAWAAREVTIVATYADGRASACRSPVS